MASPPFVNEKIDSSDKFDKIKNSDDFNLIKEPEILLQIELWNCEMENGKDTHNYKRTYKMQ